MGRKKSNKFVVLLISIILLALLYFLISKFVLPHLSEIQIEESSGQTSFQTENPQPAAGQKIDAHDLEIPLCSGSENGKTHEIIRHENYTLCYVEKYEQSEWVAYELTREELNKAADRKNNFRSDPAVSTGSASPADYKGSGYDRGHLAPAADMSFSDLAMQESFFMSNMSPQLPELNRGLWLEMEKIERLWAEKYGSVYIVSGPVLNKDSYPVIGENEVAVPEFFYKILLSWDESSSSYVWLAFLAPNAASNNNPDDFLSSVSEIEGLTGIDFFPRLNGIVE
ncbi:MAG: DNA/RNA non-specific endonuclease [Treponemataceae bacterium]|nr:DNA/RNA non-specific endonuclease [Treponemataceae bacterium]